LRADGTARLKKTPAKTTKTAPMPEESRVKSTIATIKNATPARALPNALRDTSQPYARDSPLRNHAVLMLILAYTVCVGFEDELSSPLPNTRP
jgi:hypothetical protein